MAKEYALYIGDRLVAMGTRKEIADKMNIKERTVLFYGSPSYHERCKENGIPYEITRFLVRFDDDDEDDEDEGD